MTRSSANEQEYFAVYTISARHACSYLPGYRYPERVHGHDSLARAIILIDINAFFTSVEQHERPELRDQPIGITNGATGTCIITSC